MESTSDVRQQIPRELPPMFRPPVNRAMRTLDRSFFRKTVPISAATVYKNAEISRVRKDLTVSRDMLVLPRLNVVREIQDQDGVQRKAILLREDLKHDGGWPCGVESEGERKLLIWLQISRLGHP